MTFGEILAHTTGTTPERLAYGEDHLQFGHLYLPEGAGPHPVAIVIHGGCWLAEYDLGHISHLAAALAGAGVAAWSLEYRRVGDPGGGWPGTFEDVARGADHLRELADTHPLDPDRVVAIGHSAGGHLALWLGSRAYGASEGSRRSGNPIRLRGVVSLAGITDLGRAVSEEVCGDAAGQLLGGAPARVPERYRRSSPLDLLPLGLPQRLIHGARDEIVPLAMVEDYRAAATRAGDDVRLVVAADAAHFELIAPWSEVWPDVREAVMELLGEEP
ncbi:MAG: alpha/beta hydrolase [Gemmatimonadetes bacterium]|nr:alpha/beta hydrolase [Gemmatimonadota bacterium]